MEMRFPNAPSRAAALRFGFTFEGIFRQHFIVKGRNRDTAWFSIIDTEWPRIRQGFERWLADDNFDAHGQAEEQAFRQPVTEGFRPAGRDANA